MKESVQKFDLEAAFKALNEVEIPVVKGIRPNRENLQEKFTRKLTSEVLVEDYFDVNDTEELEQANEEREGEIAKAKLARIEKIVDLEAETEEDLLPSYVGKLIMQCPQCMTLFYKNEKDIEKSDENPDIVNLNEPCQHCGNSSGYTLIGKVDAVSEEEAAEFNSEDFDENELDLDFDEEETVEEEEVEDSTDEVAAEEEEAEVDLEPLEETEEEEVKESLNLTEKWKGHIDNIEELKAELLKKLPESGIWDDQGKKDQLHATMPGDKGLNVIGSIVKSIIANSALEADVKVEKAMGTKDNWVYVAITDIKTDPLSLQMYDSLDTAADAETLQEDVEINKQMDLYNEFVKYLQKMVEQDEDALEEAKKLGNKEVIAAIEKRLENSKAELKAALPATVKDEVAELPTPEEADMEAAAENKEEPKEKKESLTENFDNENGVKAWTTKVIGYYTQAARELGLADYTMRAVGYGSNSKVVISATKDGKKLSVEESNERMTHDIKDVEDAKDFILFEFPELAESLTEDVDAERKMAAEEASLERSNAEDYIVEEATSKSKVVGALNDLEAELTEEVVSEAKYDVSDADFRAMLKNPVFNEACKDCKEELVEELPAAVGSAFDKAADAIEAAGSELTPEEQRLEDEELAAKEQVEESLTESADLFADDSTLSILIYPDRLDAETRKEKLLADPDFVKALEAFAQSYNMVAKPEDLEDGISPVDDMYACAFEGIKGNDLEDTLDELISYYVDIKAGEDLTEDAPQGNFVSKLKRNYSATELIVKELKSNPLFSKLSTRTIQRILLPYYIAQMGRQGLSAQAMTDFFAEEGFAPYVLDHFMTMDPLARKELLKADAKFMEIFNAYALEYNLFPGSNDDLEPGESEFDYAFSIAFDLGDNGEARDTEVARDTIKAFTQMYAAGKFDSTIVDANIGGNPKSTEVVSLDSAEDLDESSFNKFTENYLTEVYSNVRAFEATGCELNDNKLIVEGNITFNSGKVKPTTFVYEARETANKKVVLEGLNTDFTTDKAFTLNCNLDNANCLIVESLSYKYTINETLVEGLVK